VFACERFYKGLLHDPFQLIKGMEVVCQTVVFHDASIFDLIRRDDGKIALIEQLCSVDGFSPLFVSVAFFQNNGMRDAKTYQTVDTSSVSPCFIQTMFDVFLHGCYFIS
jgi:hypothetical protein